MEGWVAWTKIAHVAALSFWVAGLFYLPPLFAMHLEKEKIRDFHRLRAITRIVYLGVASPAAIIAIATGAALIYLAGSHGGWLVIKIGLVSLMVVFHVYCGTLLVTLRRQEAGRHPLATASLVLIPAILVPGVLYFVLVKPI